MDFDPIDTIIRDLKKGYKREISKFAPCMKSAGLSDLIVEASEKAQTIAPKIYENEKIAKICLEMKIVDQDFLNHSITVSSLAMVISFLKGLNPSEVLNTAVAALFHDIGLLETRSIVGHRRKTEQEEALWKESPIYGYYLLIENGLPEKIAKIIKHSRELWNGEGYPDKLCECKIPLESRIVFLASMYDELLRYEKLNPFEAIEYIYGGSGYHFDPDIVNLFAENISVYPLKSMVRLTTGEVGVVVNVRKNNGPRPIVKVYYDSFNKPLKTPKEIDLGEQKTIFIKQILN